MTADAALPASQPPYRPGFREFVVLMASLMALNALAIDAMIPALPAIGAALGVADANERQWVVACYMLGFGLTQLIYGPLSDRFGRKPVLLMGLGLYALCALGCALAPSFSWLLAARVAQGGAASATRVLTISIIRDRYEGAAMARIMSLVFLVFILTPVVAPTLGQLVLLVGPWRWIFVALGLFALVMLAWTLIRLPETLHPEFRRALSARVIWAGARETLTDRQSVAYTLSFTLMVGALFGYINSVQQIVFDVFARPALIGLVFAGVAGPMAITSALNAKLVERLGTRRIAHFGLLMFILFAFAHLAVSLTGENIYAFIVMQALVMASFGLASGNFGALAMAPLGHVAGTASSVQGMVSTIGGALLGLAIGQLFDGTTVPMTAGFVLLGLAALAVVAVAERGRLFGAD